MDDDIDHFSSIIPFVFSHSTWFTFLIPAKEALHLHMHKKLSVSSLVISFYLSAGGYAQKFRSSVKRIIHFRHLESLNIVNFFSTFFFSILTLTFKTFFSNFELPKLFYSKLELSKLFFLQSLNFQSFFLQSLNFWNFFVQTLNFLNFFVQTLSIKTFFLQGFNFQNFFL